MHEVTVGKSKMKKKISALIFFLLNEIYKANKTENIKILRNLSSRRLFTFILKLIVHSKWG